MTASGPGDKQSWWATPGDKLLQTLGVNPQVGLTLEQIKRFRDEFGPNRIEDIGAASLWMLLWESVKTPMMLLLLTIAGISLVLDKIREAVVMVFVVATYVGIHLLNKARADRTMARLREVQAPRAIVIREGKRMEIPAEEIVVGDIMPIQAGTRIAADARLLFSAGLLINEAALTGESAPVRKDAVAEVEPGAPLSERPTAVYTGTTVIDGEGMALIMAVGRQSEFGRVAELSTRPDTEPTPLQKEMNDLARTLAFAAICVSILIPSIGLLRGFGLEQMILTWLSLTFLMIPGQPPIIIAMSLALASLEMSRKKVVVRQLSAVETLGSVSVVLSDKTGTMTENEMELAGVVLPDGEYLEWKKSGAGDQARVFFSYALSAIPAHTADPTDLALKNASLRISNLQKPDLGELLSQRGFARSNAYRSLVYRRGARACSFVTGRPEYILERSTRKCTPGGSSGWTQDERNGILA